MAFLPAGILNAAGAVVGMTVLVALYLRAPAEDKKDSAGSIAVFAVIVMSLIVVNLL